MSEVGSASPRSDRPENRVRDHLANERTYLAWVRTSLGLVGIGFVLARMGVFLHQPTIMSNSAPHRESRVGHEFLVTGVVFLILGIVICLGSGWHYQRSRVAINAGRFEPARHIVTALTAVVVLGSLVITGLLLWQLIALDGA